jgi:hypothetical protein
VPPTTARAASRSASEVGFFSTATKSVRDMPSHMAIGLATSTDE